MLYCFTEKKRSPGSSHFDGASGADAFIGREYDSKAVDGVTHVVGTPHANSQFKFDLDRNKQLRDELQAAVGDRLKLATGCDFHLNFENLQKLSNGIPVVLPPLHTAGHRIMGHLGRE